MCSRVAPASSLLNTKTNAGDKKTLSKQCEPLSWESPKHVAYEGERPDFVAAIQKRYKHWAPKVVWVFK